MAFLDQSGAMELPKSKKLAPGCAQGYEKVTATDHPERTGGIWASFLDQPCAKEFPKSMRLALGYAQGHEKTIATDHPE